MRNLAILLITLAVASTSCVTFKDAALYLPEEVVEQPFHTSAEIYSEYMTSEAWFSKAPNCLQVITAEEAAYKGDLGISLKWNAQADGCPWLGFGFGWDAWTGKNLKNIVNEGALEFWVRMESGERTNLPWAIGFEDFTGAQAWLGVTQNAIKAEKIGSEWVRVEMPLSEFNWREQNADASNIKQLMIQVQAAGDLYIDEIRLVPYTTGYRKRVTLPLLARQDFVVDGIKNDAIWKEAPLAVGDNQVRIQFVGDYLHFAAEVQDNTPLQNNKTGSEVWNGDGIEFAFSTDPALARTRPHYFSSDQHIGISLGNEVIVWNYRRNEALSSSTVKATKNRNGFVVEGKIYLPELLTAQPHIPLQMYGLEIAINKGTISGRTQQLRWNDPANEGFNISPFRWGELYIVPEGHQNNTQ